MADWARKAISQAEADAKAKELGITTDQLYDYVMKVGDQNMFGTAGNPNAINWDKVDLYALKQRTQASPQQTA